MVDPTTRIEEENKHLSITEEDIIEPNGPRELFPNFRKLNKNQRDEQDDLFYNFDVQTAWDGLLSFEKTIFMIHPEDQEKMGILVGVNVSQEYAWKYITYGMLLENVIDTMPQTKEFKQIQRIYKNFRMDKQLLIGYVPVLTQDDTEPDERDPFIVYYDKDVIMQALEMIKYIEEYEKWVVDNIFNKKSRMRWFSLGSEQEVNLAAKRARGQIVDVEMQSVFPVKCSLGKLSMRKVADVRDGYAELIPGEKKFENVFRKRISTAIQAKAPEITLEQQTDPTFPTNAFTQYYFKVEEGDIGLDVTSEEEESRPASGSSKKVVQMVKKPAPPLSQNVDNLLEMLHFNQIDMYRNDYTKISSKPVPRYFSPYLEEILCFTDLKVTANKKISAIAWYPSLSGLVACSYALTPAGTMVDVSVKSDQLTTEYNRLMIWSLSDSLKYKLLCYAPRGIYTLSWCPYSPQYLIAGCLTGQVILWDVMDKIKKLDDEEMLSQAQISYRLLMSDFLNWAKPVDEKTNLCETIFSDVGLSHTNCVAKIDWLDRRLYITSDGKIHKTTQPKNRFFITTSVDGSIAFWDLDIDLSRRMGAKQSKGKLPPALASSESSFRKYNRIFKPVFMICLPEPLSYSQFYNLGLYNYNFEYGKNALHNIGVKFPIKVTEIPSPDRSPLTIEKNLGEFEDLSKKRKKVSQNILACSLFGNVLNFNWDGFDYDIGDPVNKEKVLNPERYANVHDGPVLQIERNPFIRDVFITIGRYIFAIWKEDYIITPIIWRKRPSELTSCAWSTDRPSVFYIGRNDGNFEAWDILARDDEPILSDILGGGILTAMAEHRPKIPKKIVAVGDYIGCLRMVKLPKILQNSYPNENELLQQYLEKEVLRKQSLIIWQKRWTLKNEDIIEARKIAEQEAKVEFEKLKKENEKHKRKEVKEEIKVSEPTKKKNIFDLPEKLERKWDEMNLKRVFEVLMIRKQVNAEKLEIETRIEKKRLAYEKSKKIALKKSLAKIDEDVAALRARILPRVKEDMSRGEMINEFVDDILLRADAFKNIKTDIKEIFEEASDSGDITITQFFDKGQERRILLNKKLGGNLDRTYYYEILKDEGGLNTFAFDLGRFDEPSEPSEPSIDKKAGGDMGSNDYDYMLDEPVHDV